MSDGAVLHPVFGWLLVLLPLVPVWWIAREILRARRGRREAVGVPTVAIARRIGGGVFARCAWLLPLLRGLALAVLVIAAARPRIGDATTRVRTEGIAIQLVVDRSGSMRALDFHEGPFNDVSRLRTRLDVVREVVEDFVQGDGGTLPGRPDDLVGVISFATTSDAVAPLTLDHDFVSRAVDRIRVSADEADQATAIGDAIALGVERLQRAVLERAPQPRPDRAGASDGEPERGDAAPGDPKATRIMILLTDGESNTGDIDPLVAADMAAAFGIRIYTIGIGSGDAVVPVLAENPFTGRAQVVRQQLPLDRETLQEIADRTGGRAFLATDPEALREVYATIDRLERTELDEQVFVDWRELAVEGGPWLGLAWPPLVLLGAGLLGLEVLLRGTRLGAAA